MESNEIKRQRLISKLLDIQIAMKTAKDNIFKQLSLHDFYSYVKDINERQRLLNKLDGPFYDMRNAEIAIDNIIEHNRYDVNIKYLKSIAEALDIALPELDELKLAQETLKGIILAGGTGTRLYPITEATSKQLVPVYDKPMIYYPLSVLMEANIKDILIITTKEDQDNFKRLLKEGEDFGINLSYIIQPSPDGLAQAFILGEKFIDNNPCAMILGDNMYYGNGLKGELNKASNNAKNGYATIFGYKVKDPERFGVMEIDNTGNVLSVEEKPKKPKSEYAITGLYFYPQGVSEKAKRITPSDRGELEITSLNDYYLQRNLLKSSLLDEGFIWFDTGTFDSLLDASNMIRSIENNEDKTNMIRSTENNETKLICSPEIIAYENGWITTEQLLNRGKLLEKNSYGKHLIKKAEKGRR